MKDINKLIFEEMNGSKELLEKKRDDVINQLNSYKDILNASNENEENFNESLFEYNDDYGYMFDISDVDEDSINIVEEICLKDPVFALKFLERKKSNMDIENYNRLKKSIVSKMNLN